MIHITKETKVVVHKSHKSGAEVVVGKNPFGKRGGRSGDWEDGELIFQGKSVTKQVSFLADSYQLAVLICKELHTTLDISPDHLEELSENKNTFHKNVLVYFTEISKEFEEWLEPYDLENTDLIKRLKTTKRYYNFELHFKNVSPFVFPTKKDSDSFFHEHMDLECLVKAFIKNFILRKHKKVFEELRGHYRVLWVFCMGEGIHLDFTNEELLEHCFLGKYEIYKFLVENMNRFIFNKEEQEHILNKWKQIRLQYIVE